MNRTPSARPRRIAVLKPDFGVLGGFERVIDRVEAMLRVAGHDVTRLTVEVNALPHRPFGVEVPDDAWAVEPEFFRYLASVEAFDRLDTRRFDLMLSTQPPSFTHRHPRHLALISHHHRIFYDLEDVYLAAGFAADPAVHIRAAELVRALDQPRLEAVTWFAAASRVVAERLERFNCRTNVSVYQAGVGVGDEALIGIDPTGRRTGPAASSSAGTVLCVGRHEFPKRTELAVHAAHHLPGTQFTLVGTGGREAWARAVDHRLAQPGLDLDTVTDTDLWLNTGLGAEPVPPGFTSNVEFRGWVDNATLDQLYRNARCVVAPAYNEDYGLTAVEAMGYGRPIVVCTDGGGLAELVTDGVHGLVVEPTGAAIAAAVDRLMANPDLAAELGANCRARAASLTWAKADAEIREALDRVLA